jgi:hypothetical protein
MTDTPEPREQIGPYTVDWIGPRVAVAIDLVLALAPRLSPATHAACQADAELVDRLLKETSRAHAQGRVFGGQTGLALIAALGRLLTAARDDLAPEDLGVPLETLDGLREDLDQAERTLRVELAE